MTESTAPSKWVRVTKHNRCPVCEKSDWCLISQDGKVAICARVENEHPAGSKGAGWLHHLDEVRPQINIRPTAPSILKTPPDTLNEVYLALISQLTLSTRHRDNLLSRGLPQAAIIYHEYRTLPTEGRGTIAHVLNKDHDLMGVPGFWFDTGNPAIAGPTGLLIPVRDTRRRIVGCQIRLDSPRVGSRYRWLSSSGYSKGASSGAPCHVSRTRDTSQVWITEGQLKADVAAYRLKRTVIAVPGVSNWPGVLPILRELMPDKVIVAFDSDKLTNNVVRAYTDAFITALMLRGYHTYEANWNPEYKGIDDLLAGGQ